VKYEIPVVDEQGNHIIDSKTKKPVQKKTEFNGLSITYIELIISMYNKLVEVDRQQIRQGIEGYSAIAEKVSKRMIEKAITESWTKLRLEIEIKKAISKQNGNSNSNSNPKMNYVIDDNRISLSKLAMKEISTDERQSIAKQLEQFLCSSGFQASIRA
jgi:hypothetical protein